MTTLDEALQKAKTFNKAQQKIAQNIRDEKPITVNDAGVQEIKGFYDSLKNSTNDNIDYLTTQLQDLSHSTEVLTTGFIQLTEGVEAFSNNNEHSSKDREFLKHLHFTFKNHAEVFSMFTSNSTLVSTENNTTDSFSLIMDGKAEPKDFPDGQDCVLFSMNDDHNVVVETYNDGFTFYVNNSPFGAIKGDISQVCSATITCTGEDGHEETFSLSIFSTQGLTQCIGEVVDQSLIGSSN